MSLKNCASSLADTCGLPNSFSTRSSLLICAAIFRACDHCGNRFLSRASAKTALAYGRAMVTFSAMPLDLRYQPVEQLRVGTRIDFPLDQLTRPGNRQRPDLLAQSITRFLYFQSDLLLGRIQNPRPFSGGSAF